MKLSISERIRMLLISRKSNRQDFMEKTEISKSRLYRILNGNEDALTPKDLKKISEYFNVSCEYLLFGEEHPTSMNTVDSNELYAVEYKALLIKE